MNYPPAESSEVLHDAVGAVLGMAGDKNVRVADFIAHGDAGAV